MSKGRLEAFSDGVFAIIVTLLVLDLKVPAGGESVFHAAGRQLPQLAVYAIAFLMVGVTWINHHAMYRAFARINRTVTVVNLVLLMFLALTPYAASLAAIGLKEGGTDAEQGVFLFTLVFLLASAMFVLTWVVATRPGSNLLAEGIDPVAARGRRVSFGLGVIVYVGLCGLSFVLPWLVVAAHLATASYYLVDQLPLDRIAVRSAD
jgi:uncharacterized membrane protein